MTVRVLTATDADMMADIHAASFDRAWPALDMAVHVARDLCLGAGEPLSAFVVLRRSDEDAEILTIATRPDCRGQGLARHLLHEAHDQMQQAGLRHVFLEVAEDNQPAKALYRALGYQPIGRRPAYYARPEGRVAAITYSHNLESTD